MVTGGDGGDGGGIYRVYHQKDIQMTAEAVFSDAGQDIPIWYNSARKPGMVQVRSHTAQDGPGISLQSPFR